MHTLDNRSDAVAKDANEVHVMPIGATRVLKDQVYSVLREAISNMDIYSTPTPPRLDERKLAEELGVSRTPVREALSRLEQEGFVRNVPRRGTFVVRKTKREVLEIVYVMAALEGMAARLASERASDEEIAGLHTLEKGGLRTTLINAVEAASKRSNELGDMMIENFEKALLIENPKEQEAYLNVVIVGGGPTGVELAGAIEELRKNVLPKDYPELDFSKMKISLVEGQERLLNGMSSFAGTKARKYLESMGIQVLLNRFLSNYDGNSVSLSSGESISSKCVIWAAGVKGNPIEGLAEEQIEKDRILVDEFNRVLHSENLYAIGDVAFMKTEIFPLGLPMLAPVAIQQANNLSKNLRKSILNAKVKWTAFKYLDKGAMATIGRNKAVVDMPFGFSFGGFFGWFTWMFIHLISIIGFRRKLLVFSNWLWNYFTYNRGNRFIIKKNH